MKTTKELARELGLLRKRTLSSSSVLQLGKRSRHNKQVFAFLVIIDFESTCWKDSKFKTQEIIEFPAVLLNTSTGAIESEFHYYVQPQEQPVLSDFCTELTGITQAQVEDGIPISLCLKKFSHWLDRLQKEKGIVFNNVECEVPATFVTWSDWDLNVCLQYEVKRKQILKPVQLNSWIDLRATYRKFYDRKPNGLNGALQDLGIEFQGREHSGLDDSRNTAKLAWRMICDGCALKITKTLKPVFRQRQSQHLPVTLEPVDGLVSYLTKDSCSTIRCFHAPPTHNQRKSHVQSEPGTSSSSNVTETVGGKKSTELSASSRGRKRSVEEELKEHKDDEDEVNPDTVTAVQTEGERNKEGLQTRMTVHVPNYCRTNDEEEHLDQFRDQDSLDFLDQALLDMESPKCKPIAEVSSTSNTEAKTPRRSPGRCRFEMEQSQSKIPVRLSSNKLSTGDIYTDDQTASSKCDKVMQSKSSSPKVMKQSHHDSRVGLKVRDINIQTPNSNKDGKFSNTKSGQTPTKASEGLFKKPSPVVWRVLKSDFRKGDDVFKTPSPVLGCGRNAHKPTSPRHNAKSNNVSQRVGPMKSTLVHQMKTPSPSNSPANTPTPSFGFKTPMNTNIRTLNNGRTLNTPCFKTPQNTPLSSVSFKTPVSNGCTRNFSVSSAGFKTPVTSCYSTPSNSTPGSAMKSTPPLCKCGRRAKRRVVQSPGPNVGRFFFTCAIRLAEGNSKKGGCDFFKWETPSSSPNSSLSVSRSCISKPFTPVIGGNFSQSQKRNLGVRCQVQRIGLR